jgi:general secretion pathway protein K
MRTRRGVALIAALWLVVAIATVALQFSIEARDRRTVGIATSERGMQRALAAGALALVQAKLDYALRVGPTGANVQRLRAADPWLDVDSVYSGTFYVDSIPVLVEARDMGEKLNLNVMTENELRTFFSFLLNDYSKAQQLSQTIMDWRDFDSIPRPSGAEVDDYIKAEMLALPTNATFREVEELQNVMGMTPEIYAAAAPYLSTRGNGAVNLNTAPVLVLRTLPGMTDALLNRILQLRSQGRRIEDAGELFTPPGGRGRAPAGIINTMQAQQQLRGRTTTRTTQIELTITAQIGPQAQPTRLIADINNGGNRANVTFRQW